MALNWSEAYNTFFKAHMERARGEQLRRLKEGHGHAERLFLEKVWWPAVGHFQHLYPEYEVYDYKDGYRYLDFAYIRPQLRLALEIDGFGPHWRNASRQQFSDQWQRQNHLVIDGWRVLRFSYDDVAERPRLCQQTVQQFMGRWLGDENHVQSASALEKEIVRFALREGRPITPGDASELLRIEERFARKLLRGLVEKQWLLPASGTQRIRSYRPNLEGKNFTL